MGAALARSISDRLDALAPEGGIGVAASGGGDSTALLLIAIGWAARTGRTLEAATVDHRMRAESQAEAAMVASLCGRLGIHHETLVWNDRPETGNLSAAAREARIALLGAWARRRGLAFVALGHTLDDQAETVLLRLARGAGVDGLSGMAARVDRDGAAWIRPLLDARREELRGYLRGEGVGWVDDPTNDDENYARIRMRALIGGCPDLDARRLSETARRLQGQRAALDWLADELAARALKWSPLGDAVLDLHAMRRAPEDTQLRLLARTLGDISATAYRPRQSALAPLLAELLAGGEARTLHGCIASSTREFASICREPSAATSELEAVEGVIWDGRWRIDTVAPGTMVARLGEKGEAALARFRKSHDWTASAEWRAAQRASRLASPALWRGATLVAAPLAGFGSSRATLTPSAGMWRTSRRDRPFNDAAVT